MFVVIVPFWLFALLGLLAIVGEALDEEGPRPPRTPSPRERKELDRHAEFLAQERARLEASEKP